MTEREWARIQKKKRLQRQRRVKRIKRNLLRAGMAMISVGAIVLFVKAVAPARTDAKQELSDQVVITLAPQTEAATEILTETVTEETTEHTGTLIASRDWDAEEGYMLAKIAMAEAEGEDVNGKALVMLTVLNRVWSDSFPKTITEVIAQPGAFTAYINGRYDRLEPDADCWAALHKVQYEGWDISQGATYFESTPAPGVSTWHNRNLQQLFTYGGHTFYREKTEE